MLSIREAAQCLNVSPNSVDYWVHTLRLVAKVRVGHGRGRIRLVHRDLEVLIHRERADGLAILAGGKGRAR